MPPSIRKALVTVVTLAFLPSLLAAPPAAPTNFQGISVVNQELDCSWDDNSNDEDAFEFFISTDSGVSYSSIGTVPADLSFFRLGTFPTGTDYLIRITAINTDGSSAPSNSIPFNAFFASVSLASNCLKLAELDSVNVTSATTGFTSPTYTAEGLPSGVTIDPSTGLVSGAPTVRGYFQATIFATELNHKRKASLGISVLDPPVIVNPISAEADTGTISMIALDTAFEDPDVESTVMIETNLGDIPITLFDSATPITAQNFKNYMNDGDWDGSFIHRAIPEFIVQAGGYSPDGSGDFVSVPDDAPIQNEYDDSRPNACGTFAMAKLGGNPDSATSEWFINLTDNAQNLDYQNEGFTTFARVLGDGLSVFEAIAALDRGTYSVTIDGLSRSFSDWPLTTTSATSPLESELVILTKVASVPAMQFDVASNTAPTVVAASISPSGTTLMLNHASPGTAEITIGATDLDGLRTEHTFTAVTNIRFSDWASGHGVSLAAENDDNAGLTNLQEFAFGGDPNDPTDDQSLAPYYSNVADTMGNVFVGMRASLHRFAPELSYKVQWTSDLVNWTTAWQSSDGFSDPAIAGFTPNGIYLDVIVNTGQILATTDTIFLRTVVDYAP